MANSTGLSFWIASVLKWLIVLFLAFDSIIKIIKHQKAMEASMQVGFAPPMVPVLGMFLLLFTVVYIFPATSILGLILITAFLGGATATVIIAHQPRFSIFFPVVICIILWAAELMLKPELRDCLFKFNAAKI